MLHNAFILAMREIRRNVRRSSLTMLGVAAFIIMVTIGGDATASVSQQITRLGSNMLIITPGQYRGPGGVSGGAETFNIEHVNAIKTEIAGLRAVTPLVVSYLTAIYGNKNWATAVNGTDNQFLRVREWQVVQGRKFADSELRSGRAVCKLGSTVKSKLFGGRQAIGESIRLGKVSCRVIGVLGSKGQTMMVPPG